MGKDFFSFYLGTIFKPKATFELLLVTEKSLSKSFIAVLITAILYTFVYIFLIRGGGQPYKPWLNIPPEVYYKYNVFFCAPSMFLGWVLAAGVVRIISRLFHAGGTFQQTLTVFGLGISIASWTTGIHDIVSSFLGAIHIINQHDYELALNSPTIWRNMLWILMSLYVLWFVALFSKGVKAVYHFSTLGSVIMGLIGFSVYQFFFFIFNR